MVGRILLGQMYLLGGLGLWVEDSCWAIMRLICTSSVR